jgi:hypothetical protein
VPKFSSIIVMLVLFVLRMHENERGCSEPLRSKLRSLRLMTEIKVLTKLVPSYEQRGRKKAMDSLLESIFRSGRSKQAISEAEFLKGLPKTRF